MGMQMNIKNSEAYALATELAEREGVTLTQAVLDALRARKRELTQAERLERVMQIAREARARMTPEYLAINWDEELYDEYGLPK